MDSEREKENDPGVTMLDVLQEILCQLDFLEICFAIISVTFSFNPLFISRIFQIILGE